MSKSHLGQRIFGATGAAVLTGLSCSIFALGEPRAVADEKPTCTARVDTSQIDRGRYLVKTTGCNDCHTPGYNLNAGNVPESQWLTGDRLGFQGPWGTTYPANLRRLMQGSTVEQWLLKARQPTRPPMPWFALRDMNDQDLKAIYYFVRSLGPSQITPPAFVPPGQNPKTQVVKFAVEQGRELPSSTR